MAIIMADDDLDDCRLLTDAWAEAGCISKIVCVSGGAELHDYLALRGEYADALPADVVLLDLNMPLVSGWDVLEELEATSGRSAPVVVLTTSSAKDDVDRAFQLGASGFVTKPRLFSEMVHLAQIIDEYWFGVSTLPDSDSRPLAPGAN